MKTYISITGQINSVTKLKNTIKQGKMQKLGNNYYIQYQTKKEAVKELKTAFKKLMQEDFEGIGINYLTNTLEYDAGVAKLHIGKINT